MTGHEQTTVELRPHEARIRPIPSRPSLELTATQRRRTKRRRFFIFELSALLILFASVSAGISERFANESLTKFFEITTIVAALAVGLIPVIFYGFSRRDEPNPPPPPRRGCRHTC